MNNIHINLNFKPTLATEGQIQFLDLVTTAETDQRQIRNQTTTLSFNSLLSTNITS